MNEETDNWDIEGEIKAMRGVYNALLPLNQHGRENVIKAVLRDLNPKALKDEDKNE